MSFHSAFLLYAPKLLSRRVDIPYTTSHVDIAPTILALLGIDTDSMLIHGEDMLDRRIRDRATFMMGTGISPTDGFQLGDRRLEYNNITRALEVILAASAGNTEVAEWTSDRVRQLLGDANHVFNLTAAEFLGEARSAGN